MYPWNNLSTLLLTAGSKVMETALDDLSQEAVAEVVTNQGYDKASELLLGIYHALEKLHSSATALRDALGQWVKIIQKMADHQLKYAPKEAQDQLLAAIDHVEEALSELIGYIGQTDVLAVRFRSSSRYSKELIEGRLMGLLEPEQYNVEAGAPHAARILFVARLNHLISLADGNIQRIEEVGGQVATILRDEFGFGQSG
jgi:hypothetical protein